MASRRPHRPRGSTSRAVGLRDRVVAADPGLLRLTLAGRGLTAILLGLGSAALAGLPLPAVILSALCALISTFTTSRLPGPRKLAALAAMWPVGAAVLTLATLLAPHVVVSDIVFCVLIFVAAYGRRYGPLAFALGMLAFVMFFLVEFLKPGLSQVPAMLLGVAIGLAANAVATFVVLRTRRERVLLRAESSLRARALRVGDAIVEELARSSGRTEREEFRGTHREEFLRRIEQDLDHLHACALMIEGHLDEIAERPGRREVDLDAWRYRVAAVELATERLALRAVRLLPDGIGEYPVRAFVTGELRAVRRAFREPGARLGPADVSATRRRLAGYRNRESLPDVPPAAKDLLQAIGELTIAGVQLRRIYAESTDSSGAADLEAVPGGAEGTEERVDVEAEHEEEQQADEQLRGLRRPTTRLAIQVTAAAGMAIVGGELLSPQRWYWAVIAAWVMFISTASIGDSVLKGMRRLAGTGLGIVSGMLVAFGVHGHTGLAFGVAIACMFCMMYFAGVAYGFMTFCVTTMLGVLYSLLGKFSPGLLLLRLEETAIGFAAGLIAVTLILPTTTNRNTDSVLADALQELRDFLTEARDGLNGTEPAPVRLLDDARDLDRAVDDVARAFAPLVHPVSPWRSRRASARHLLGLVRTCAYHARSLAAAADRLPAGPSSEGPAAGDRGSGDRGSGDRGSGDLGSDGSAPGRPGSDHLESGRLGSGALDEPIGRIDANLEVLIGKLRQEPVTPEMASGASAGESVGALEDLDDLDVMSREVIRHLDRIDERTLALGRPLGVTVHA